MIEKLLITVTLFVGLTSVIVSVALGNDATLYIKPVFIILLFILYTYKLKRFNPLLFLALLSVMLGESFVSQGMSGNSIAVTVLFGAFFSLATILILPVVLKTKMQRKNLDIVSIIIAVAAFLYLVGSAFWLSIETFGNNLLFGIATFAFCAFIFSCFYISGFHRHRKSIFLFIVGMGYFLVTLGAILYETLFSSPILLFVINLCEIIAQFSFVYFLIHVSEILDNRKWVL